MICPKCKKQIPDNSEKCSFCDLTINHKEHIVNEIKLRRYQRWFFYALISIIFIACILMILKVYNSYQKLLDNEAGLKIVLEETKEVLTGETTKYDQLIKEFNKKKDDIKKLEGSIFESSQELEKQESKIKEQAKEYENVINNNELLKSEIEEKGEIEVKINQCKSELDDLLSDISSLIINLGMGITNENLKRILIAESNLINGEDSDKDGISDSLELAIGTNKDLLDTDGDSFSDKDEILTGYNPIEAESKLNIDIEFSKALSGKILLQVESKGEAWYVNPEDNKRYYLGNPQEALKILSEI